MSNWFYAANGQQQGPFGDAQLRDLITNGTVRADTLVWTEGMAGWQKAGEVPGLMPPGGPPMMPQGGPPSMMGAGGATGSAISADLPPWRDNRRETGCQSVNLTSRFGSWRATPGADDRHLIFRKPTVA